RQVWIQEGFNHRRSTRFESWSPDQKGQGSCMRTTPQVGGSGCDDAVTPVGTLGDTDGYYKRHYTLRGEREIKTTRSIPAVPASPRRHGAAGHRSGRLRADPPVSSTSDCTPR